MSRKLKKDRKTQASTKGSRTTGSYKRFSKEEFEQTKRAVTVIAEWHERMDCFVDENHEDRFGPDLIEWVGFKPVRYIEVAQRSAWKEGPWNRKWDPVNIEERKAHLFKLSLPCDYWVVNRALTSALIVKHETVVKYLDSMEEVSNRAIRAGELFIRIPLDECDEVYLGDDNDIQDK